MNKLLVVSLYLFLIFLNQNNIIGLFILLSSFVTYFRSVRLAIVHLLFWLVSLYVFYQKKRESFQGANTTQAVTSTTTAPVTNRGMTLLVQIENQPRVININVYPENTFGDLIRFAENQSGTTLDNYKPGVHLITSTGVGSIYYLSEAQTAMTIDSFNRMAREENAAAAAPPQSNTLTQQERENREFRRANRLPQIGNQTQIRLAPIATRDRLRVIIKNLSSRLTLDPTIDNLLSELEINYPEQMVNFRRYTGPLINNTEKRRLITFGFMFHIPGFDDRDIINNIKRNSNLVILSAQERERIMRNQRNSFTLVQNEGIHYFYGSKIFHPKYVLLLNILNLNDIFDVEDINTVLNNSQDYNVEQVRDMRYILILLIKNNSLTDIDLNDTTRGWILRGLRRINENYERFFDVNDRVLNRYNLRQRVNNVLTNQRNQVDSSFRVDFGMIDMSSQARPFDTESRDNREFRDSRGTEFQEINRINRAFNTYETQRNRNQELVELDKIQSQFSNVLLDIMNEIVELFGQESEESFSNYMEQNGLNPENMNMNRYIYIFKNIVLILTRDGRMLYVGLLFLAIALFLYFIEASK